MLSKFISVSETCFQNTEIALKNQQASIQGLETQISQLSKLISERPQDDEGVVELEPEPRQETVVSKGQGEASHNKNKSVNVEYKPRVPYPNATRKDRSDEQFGKFLKLLKKLHINLPFIEALSQMPNAMKFLKELLANKRKLDEASHMELNAVITLQARNSGNTLEIEGDRLNHSTKTDNMVQPSLQEMSLKENKLNTFPNQLKVGGRVLLDVADPHIVATTPNEEIPLTVLSIFPFGTVEVSHPKFGSFKVNNTRLKPYFDEMDSRNEEFSTETQPSTLACLGPCENRAKISPNTGYDKMPRLCNMAMVEPVKTTWVCDTPCGRTVGKLVRLTRAWVFIHGRGRSEQRQTRPCAPTRPRNTCVY
ncbi:hypothetical protein GOBAR_AA09936 [Gossypium barbadense]|uniref:Uncharacterized protein n=1 Tax=Gossypium barbadense TaxID=3634 RepID=A0A2P5Y561_GOSBA|nr:hypothetical protein GOBAR_AA09936 [Gossypium barbadense]